MAQAHLLTGEPSAGKTTALKGIVDRVGRDKFAGFYTEEIRVDGVRWGFRIVTLGGESAVIASMDMDSSLRVGKYGVDLAAFERIALPIMADVSLTRRFLAIDEIGPMQLHSARYLESLIAILQSETVLLGTIVRRSHPAADQVKLHPNVQLYTITPNNRDSLETEIARSFS